MRKNKREFEAVSSGRMIGDKRPSVRVTVEPDWKLETTVQTYANTLRGPYRYYVDNADTRVEVEVPQIKSVQIDRTLSQDVATCKITMYNQSHNGNTLVPELGDQLGKPGYFWPKRGVSSESHLLWNQTAATGAKYRNGTWDSNFEWTNVLIPNGLIRTYAGHAKGTASIDQDVTDGKIMLTGVWLIDRISGGADGTLLIECRDVGRLLLEQIIYPPLVPNDLYPLAYFPPGKSKFDSSFDARPVTGVGRVSQAEVRCVAYSTSFGMGDVSGHSASEAADMNRTNWSWSPARATPTSGSLFDWWEFVPIAGGQQVIDAVDFRPWAGGYTAYISVNSGGVWQGSETIPDSAGGGGLKYLKKVQVPYNIPNGDEGEIHVQLDAPINMSFIRITLGPTYHYSGVAQSGMYYRSGLRTVMASRIGAVVPPYDAPFNQSLWAFAMASHPVRGYWVADKDGWVYGFGDAADYDSSTYGQVPLAYVPGINGENYTQVSDIAAHPSGRGYWVLTNDGYVRAYGAATFYGDGYVGVNTHMDGPTAISIAETFTGNGYWVAYSNGIIRGFGDASPSYVTLPYTALTNYMINHGPSYQYLIPDSNPLGLLVQTAPPSAYAHTYRCRGISGHPRQMGFVATDGSGQVFSYNGGWFGELTNRVFNPGAANQFFLWPKEYANCIEYTQSGNGYWINFLSGHIAAFGDAINQGTSYVYEGNSQLSASGLASDLQLYKMLTQKIARDPDGTGFWVLVADGSVLHYNADWWGQPGWANRQGYRWHDGNCTDYSRAVQDMLAWAGFTYYNSNSWDGSAYVTGHDRPPVLGNIESTGIPTTTVLDGDKWDKRTVMDCINELKNVTGYNFFIDDEGLPRFESPNFWRAGNRDSFGQRIFAKYETDGSWAFVDESIPGAEPFIPDIHEAVDLINYTASLDGEAVRSEIIIGSDMPDLNDPTRTQFVRFTPPSAVEEVRPGVPALRNINRPAAWVNTNFENPSENLLMAELIALRIWFSQRTSSATIVYNANLSIGDQIRLIERNTSETAIHIINSISSTIDLDAGTAISTINTNWLGDANDWVITSDNTYNPITHVGVSERVDRWQLALNKGLAFHGDGMSTPTLSGGFN